MSTRGFAVVDVETTGLFPGGSDRVIELAVVTTDEFGTVTGEWETVVNPRRHIGAGHVHGLDGATLMNAPAFADILPDLVDVLDGRAIVAHNASFDRRFLAAEFARTHTLLPDDAPFVCTMRLAREIIPGAGRSLADCCAAFDVELSSAHHALGDARATAELLAGYIATTGAAMWRPHLEKAASVSWRRPEHPSPEPFAAWMPRATARDDRHFLERMSAVLPEVSAPEAHLDYLALLDRCLIDRHLSQHEAVELIALADELGVDRPTALALHESYVQQLAAVAWADGVLSADERADIEAVARMLGVSDDVRERALDARDREPATPVAPAPAAGTAASAIAPGSIVVLTGAMSRPREQWEADLVAAGFRTASAVSKKVNLVVAADPDSLSGKARKARDYGIPVVGESFLSDLLARGVPGSWQ